MPQKCLDVALLLHFFIFTTVTSFNSNISAWDQGYIDIKLAAKQVIYQKLVHFLYKKNIYANRPESVIFGR